jgi:uncharacterized protein (DUF2252 family)
LKAKDKISSKQYTSLAVRKKVLAKIRRAKEARSPHAYVRGSTRHFYEWLNSSAGTSIPQGPLIWICGDCHMGNLGPMANAKGDTNIEIRDFDQTVIGNPAHDLIRLGLSLACAARSSDLPGAVTIQMVEALIEGYLSAFSEPNKKSKREVSKPKVVKAAIKTALSQTWNSMAREKIEDARPNIPLGKRFWPLSQAEQKEIKVLFSQEKIRRMVTSLRRRDSESSIEVLDAAFWVKGCSSLGNLRYAVLLEIDGDQKEYCLIDIKEALPPVAPCPKNAKLPKDDSERVVTGAWHMSPGLGDRIVSARFQGRPVFLRELLPQDLKFEMEHLKLDEAIQVARHLASVVGKAHARQMDSRTRRTWQNHLLKHRTKAIQAPAWLWTSIVDLIVIHERAYLEHCHEFSRAHAGS